MRYLAFLLGVVISLGLPLGFSSCALIPDKKEPAYIKGYVNAVYRLPPRARWSPQIKQVNDEMRERMARDRQANRAGQDYGPFLERELARVGLKAPKNTVFKLLPEQGFILAHTSPEFHKELSQHLVRLQ